ncbi:MAG TPA: zf-HC2 domain-containing protein, partial [Terriglobia bacterium]|nr:zf-HC2 domain-containing protein [Terriglobia bacterium]
MKKDQRAAPALDRVTAGIREARIDPAVVESAAQRVWARLSERPLTPRPATVEGAPGIRGCDGFRALIPAYLASNLSEPRVLLFEDHVAECVGCRRALHETRSGGARQPISRTEGLRAGRPRLQWAVAALAAAAALGAVIISQGLLFRGGGARATVSSVEGAIYRVSDAGSSVLAPGQEISEGEEVRT